MADKPVVIKKVIDKTGRKKNALYCDEPTLTVQSFANDTDINQIIARALSGHDITQINERVAKYGDFSNVPNYQDALDLVRRAEDMFKLVPSKVRDRFENDPAKMIEFLQNDANRPEAIELGLVKAPTPVVDTPKTAGNGV